MVHGIIIPVTDITLSFQFGIELKNEWLRLHKFELSFYKHFLDEFDSKGPLDSALGKISH
jgi:hypothetical protein